MAPPQPDTLGHFSGVKAVPLLSLFGSMAGGASLLLPGCARNPKPLISVTFSPVPILLAQCEAGGDGSLILS